MRLFLLRAWRRRLKEIRAWYKLARVGSSSDSPELERTRWTRWGSHSNVRLIVKKCYQISFIFIGTKKDFKSVIIWWSLLSGNSTNKVSRFLPNNWTRPACCHKRPTFYDIYPIAKVQLPTGGWIDKTKLTLMALVIGTFPSHGKLSANRKERKKKKTCSQERGNNHAWRTFRSDTIITCAVESCFLHHIDFCWRNRKGKSLQGRRKSLFWFSSVCDWQWGAEIVRGRQAWRFCWEKFSFQLDIWYSPLMCIDEMVFSSRMW